MNQIAERRALYEEAKNNLDVLAEMAIDDCLNDEWTHFPWICEHVAGDDERYYYLFDKLRIERIYGQGHSREQIMVLDKLGNLLTSFHISAKRGENKQK